MNKLEQDESQRTAPKWWIFWVLTAAAVALQLVWRNLVGADASSWIASPLLPLVVCLAAQRKAVTALVPLVLAVFLLQPLLHLSYGLQPSWTWLLLSIPCYACFWLAGRLARRSTARKEASKNPGLGGTILAGCGGAIGFYLLSNTFAWISPASGYPLSLSGWFQSQTIGLPQFGVPSWYFLRALLISQLVFVPPIYAALQAGYLAKAVHLGEGKLPVASIKGSR